MGDIGRTLIVLGGIVALVGVVLLIAGRSGLPIGRLPGDIVFRGKNTTIYFPIITSLILSVVLSVVFLPAEPLQSIRIQPQFIYS